MPGSYLSYDLLRGLHILAVIAWMAGLLYLPRLFVYHVAASPGSALDRTFSIMERRLLRYIMNPSMIAAWVLGFALMWSRSGGGADWSFLGAPWMMVKLAGVAFVTAWHHYLAVARQRFARAANRRSAKFWRMTNELPFLAAIIMVLSVTLEYG